MRVEYYRIEGMMETESTLKDAKITAKEYIKDLEKEDFQMLFGFVKNTQSPLYKEVVARKAELLKVMPEAQYSQIIKSLQLNTIMETAYNKDTKSVDDKKFMAEAEKLMSKKEAESTLVQVKMKMALRAKKYEDYEKYALDYYKDGGDPSFNSNELNEVAWNFFEKVNNKKSLEIAVQWAAQSVKRNEEYANMDTLANLYIKIGDKVNAKKWAEKAIEKATQDGEDATSTRELLNKL